jgi:16S rRNA (cytidine1402-2'-O)-methyltransferase
VELKLSGTLYIVATPIGNLEDITFRAVRVLKEVDIIASEDTRQTRKLLDHYGIRKPQISYHEHNEKSRAEELLGELQSGKNIALVSDAGTPLIADPGYRLVDLAREAGVAVSPVPGPSAIVAALSASGLPSDSFLFHGFLPPKSTQRRKLLEQLKPSESTLIFYETPHRIVQALSDIEAVLGARPIVLARELTKLHEEFLWGTARELRQTLEQRSSVKGEFVLMIGKSGEPPEQENVPLEDAVVELIRQGIPKMEALKAVAKQRGLPKREVYKKFNER